MNVSADGLVGRFFVYLPGNPTRQNDTDSIEALRPALLDSEWGQPANGW